MTPEDTPLSPATAARLDARLDALRRATDALAPGPGVEARLDAVLSRRRARALISRWMTTPALRIYLAPVTALAACVGVLGWILLYPPVPGGGATSERIEAVPHAETFVALESLERIAIEPQVVVVSRSVPRMLLASVGVPVDPAQADDRVNAELLVGANGQALAFRIVN